MIEKLPAKNSAKVSRQNSRAHKQPALNGSQACHLCSQSASQSHWQTVNVWLSTLIPELQP